MSVLLVLNWVIIGACVGWLFALAVNKGLGLSLNLWFGAAGALFGGSIFMVNSSAELSTEIAVISLVIAFACSVLTLALVHWLITVPTGQ